MKPTSILPFIVLAVLVGGCAGQELDSQREQWEAARPAHYSFTYEATGWTPNIVKAIEIKENEVVSVSCSGSSAPNFPCEGLTIDELFDWVERSVDDAEVKYDPQWHFPAKVDFAGTSEEGGWGFVVTDFATLE